ncbi:hypothetical protein RUM43_002270 [Polyplax serrata]|uniref:Uncharacterized protein n=1 Tax=Polyplax serrata TaxID=468196 RepID=A0AAN8NUB8_POLSC
MELYYFEPSPPCRAVLLFLHELNIKPTMKKINLLKGENLTADFKSLNPQQTIPLIIDDGFVLSESRAILIYLAEQYGQNSNYYPNDPKTRGVINQRLMFDIGTLYSRFFDAYSDSVNNVDYVLDAKKVSKIHEAFEFLEAFMADSMWMSGDAITIADYSLVATVSSIEACGFDISKYKKVLAWLDRCKSVMSNYEEINQKGANMLGNVIKDHIHKEA